MKVKLEGFGKPEWLPKRQTNGSGGYDLFACLEKKEVIYPGTSLIVPCGFSVELPKGHVGLIVPRSGLARKYSITVLHSPGVIDSDYRGETSIHLYMVPEFTQFGQRLEKQYLLTINPGDRIGQMLVVPVFTEEIELVDTLSSTDRGNKGWGSTGV